MLSLKSELFYEADRAVKGATLRLIEPLDNGWFLDCGPGNCKFTQKITNWLGNGNVCVADYNENRRVEALKKGWLATCCDFNSKINYADSWFHAIHAGQIIEHLNNTDTFVKELYRILKPNGYLVISTPNLASWHNIAYLVAGKQPHVAMVSDEIVRWHLDDEEVEEPKHRRILTPDGLAMLLIHHGFKIEKVVGAGYYPFTGWLARMMSSIDRNHAVYTVIKARKV